MHPDLLNYNSAQGDQQMAVSTKSKFYSGEVCPKSATYGQYSDRTGYYAGKTSDRRVDRGERFPPSLNNHHFREK